MGGILRDILEDSKGRISPMSKHKAIKCHVEAKR
jgi:hypothetical protein